MNRGVEYVLADVGSTTTKVIAVGGDPPRVLARSARPTTVEPPLDDASIGFDEAVKALGLGVAGLLGPGEAGGPGVPGAPGDPGGPPPKVLLTSSAAGGLKILVAGLVRRLSAESAQRASMGAGGVVLDVLAVDDGRTDVERVDLARSLRPDLILVAGGFDGSRGPQVLEMAEILAVAAAPEARVPLIYAGSADLAEAVQDSLSNHYEVRVAANLRPEAGVESFAAVTQAIQEVFMDHVMAHAPGYDKLRRLAHLGVLPTPAAVGRMAVLLAEEEGATVLAVDVGGATTDVFSVAGGLMFRTVSANLGVSYSLGNTLVEAGVPNFRRWLDESIGERALRNAVYRKVTAPTRLPETELDWGIDAAGAIEALRLALQQHLDLSGTLAPVTAGGLFQSREEAARRFTAERVRLRMLDVDLIVGSGGSLSYARSPRDAARILIEGLRPEGVTKLVLDTCSTMSHFGNLSRVDRDLAFTLAAGDLVPLAVVVSPVGEGRAGQPAVRWTAEARAGGRTGGAATSRETGAATGEAVAPATGVAAGAAASGEIVWLSVPPGETLDFVFEPGSGLDLGAGPGNAVRRTIAGVRAGLVVDARLRPATGPDRAGRALPAAWNPRWRGVL